MITKCYLLNANDNKVVKAITRICDLIPCFIDAKTVSENRFEFTIRCRQEDIVYVERVLAPFV